VPEEPNPPEDKADIPQSADPYETSESSDLLVGPDSPDDPYEGATPPGYDDWPTHGGYLGCLMGVVLGLVLAPLGYILFGLVGAALFPHLGYGGAWLAGILTVIVWLVCFVSLARLGWRLGKRFYREYPRPAGASEAAASESAVSETSAAQGR